MQVWQWLDVSEWNLEAGKLVEGAEVTVGGEEAGQERAPGAFWAKIVSKRERDLGDQRTYTSSIAAGRQARGGPGEARCATASSSSNATLVSLLTRSTTGKHQFDLFLVRQC